MTTQRPLRLGTRGSGLALRQTEQVLARLRQAFPHHTFTTVTVRTSGDRDQTSSLTGMGRGVFVKELEAALLEGRIDAAVHSLKDLPTDPVPGLAVSAILERDDPRDALVNRWGCPLADLPAVARIGTSSPRRAAQVRAMRPDVRVLPIRGNVDTRLRKALGADYDGAVLAAAGLKRLGLLAQASELLPPEEFIPAPGQGALAVEVRSDDRETIRMVGALEHPATRAAVEAERAFLRALGGGCQVPVGAYARASDTTLEVCGLLAREDGSLLYRTSVTGPSAAPEKVGQDLYHKLMEMGAGRLLSAQG